MRKQINGMTVIEMELVEQSKMKEEFRYLGKPRKKVTNLTPKKKKRK